MAAINLDAALSDETNAALFRAAIASAHSTYDASGIDSARLKANLLNSGLIDNISKNFETYTSIDDSKVTANDIAAANILPPNYPPFNKDKRYLLLNISKGLAFLALSDVAEDPTTSLQIHLHYRESRATSNPVMSAVEPSFNFSHMFELHSRDIQVLLQCSDAIHVVVNRMHHPTGSIELVGTTSIDIRESLCGKPAKKFCEIKESGEDVTLGVLEVSIECIPRDIAGVKNAIVSLEEVSFQLKREQRQFDEINRLFYMHAKQWWNDYLQIRSCHAQRLVKLFTHNERGQKLPVTNFVSPIRSRYIETPHHAARFVSLISLEKSQGIGTSKIEVWANLHTVATLSKAPNSATLATILTSLLLGFNLPAYTALGYLKADDTPAAWVILASTGTGVEMVDPATARRYSTTDAAIPWSSVGCVFNDEGFWANVAVSDTVKGASFDLTDSRYWKALGRDAVLSMKLSQQQSFPIRSFTFPTTPQICLSESTAVTCEIELETVLKNQIAIYRDTRADLLTTWDDELAHLLTQCLCACEMEKIFPAANCGQPSRTSCASNGVKFQEGVRRAIPEGHTFKGFPVHFNTLNPQKIFTAFTQSKTCQSLILTRGDKVRFGVRVKLVGYAEKCVACWVMVAVRYKPYE
ncbi:Centrosomal protein of 76 kDa [Physocladia obscura]|uniref:Centrosomal protein of 76 kDa n=1 Tax=Physocladia obscura TaxID=109957 RepID=A0AAD5XGX9_9FUNG|nr:Centrosomal protein of 76 kDa [Physocladia obscura]